MAHRRVKTVSAKQLSGREDGEGGEMGVSESECVCAKLNCICLSLSRSSYMCVHVSLSLSVCMCVCRSLYLSVCLFVASAF